MADVSIVRGMTLLDILSNPLVFDQIISHLPLQAILRLSRLSHAFHHFVFHEPRVFRYLDLSRCRGAFISQELTPIDMGGNRWRAARMDENLTEDEFYAGPLRGTLAKLSRKMVLQDVQVLVLDELASVTNDLIVEITTKPEYNIRMISIRKCINVNQPRLQQYLRFLCRPERPAGTPKLQAVYNFTDPGTSRHHAGSISRSEGVVDTNGAVLGVPPIDRSRPASDADPWYSASGQMVSHGYLQRTSWEETLMSCRGIIAFDAVLCTHMHDAMAHCLHEASRQYLSTKKPGITTMATVALGPDGCSGCGTAPPGSPVWGESEVWEFPLLWPPPYSGQVSDAVRPPAPRVRNVPSNSYSPAEQQRLIVSCTWCLTNRHCDNCHRWWCGDCYNPKKEPTMSEVENRFSDVLRASLRPRDERIDDQGGSSRRHDTDADADVIKVIHGLCVEDCMIRMSMSGGGATTGT